MISNYVLQNNLNSSILNKLKDISFKKEPLYIDNNIPNNFKSILELTPINNNPVIPVLDTKYIFNIDSSNFLKNLLIKVVFTTPAGMADLEFNSYRFFKDITLYQNYKPIFTNNPGYIKSRILDSGVDKQTYFESLNNISIVEDTEYTVYIPLFSYFFDYMENNILLDYSKNLELHLTYNEELPFTPISIFPSLFMYKTCYEQDLVNSYINKLSKSPTNYLMYDTYLKKVLLPDTSTTKTIEITSKKLIQSFYLTIINEDDFSSPSINHITLQCGDKIVLTNINQKIVQYDNINFLPHDNNEGSFSYHFDDKMRKGHSGSLDISQPTFITISYDAIVGDNVNLYINLEFLNVITLDNINGKFNTLLLH